MYRCLFSPAGETRHDWMQAKEGRGSLRVWWLQRRRSKDLARSMAVDLSCLETGGRVDGLDEGGFEVVEVGSVVTERRYR